MRAPQRLSCPVCDGQALVPVFAISGVPVVCNRLLSNQREALSVVRGRIDLVCCRDCGHLFNRAFDPALVSYEGRYDNSLNFSERYRRYAARTARRLIDRYDLRGKRIVEIGCGSGDFLRLLCRLGGNRGTGYDPSDLTRSSNEVGAEEMTIIADIYREGAAQDAHFVCCRHVLEHLLDPVALIKSVGEDFGRRGGAAFFEVPDAAFVLDRLSVWDIIYEHVSYFSRTSLRAAITRGGLSVRDMRSDFGNQFLWAEAVSRACGTLPRVAPSRTYERSVAVFAKRADALLTHWRAKIARCARDGIRLVLWGAGSKGVMFLNLAQIKVSDALPYIVDINPRKIGCYVAGTGQQIIAPPDLRQYRPDVVLIMNPEYAREISKMLLEHDVPARIELLFPRSSAGIQAYGG